AVLEVSDIGRLWEGIAALDRHVAVETQLAMLDQTTRLVERMTRWLVRRRRPPLDISATVAYFAPGVTALMQELPSLLTDTERQTLERASAALTEKGVPTVLALWVTGLGMLFSALDIIEIAHTSNLDVETVAEMY